MFHSKFVLDKGRFQRKNLLKSLVFCQTSLDPHPPVWCFTTPNFLFWEWTIDARNKFYTWSHLKIFIFDSVIFVHFCPKSDNSGALGPLHYITLKSFTMNLMDGTKWKHVLSVLEWPGPMWSLKNLFFFFKNRVWFGVTPLAPRFGKSPDFSEIFPYKCRWWHYPLVG